MDPSNCDTDSPSSANSSATPTNQIEVEPWVRRKPIPRKGHTKSRRGCFNCKRRRIKCNEKRPDCNHCIKAGLQCEYPLNVVNTMRVSSNPQEKISDSVPCIPETFVSDIWVPSRLLWQILTTLGNARHALVPSVPRYRVSTSTRWRR